MLVAEERIGGRPHAADHLRIDSRQRVDPHLRDIFTKSPLIANLPPEDRGRLLASARPKEFLRRDVLFMDGDPVEEVLLLLSGLVKISKLGTSGTVAILGLNMPGDILGAANLFFTDKYSVTAEAVHPCRVLAWPASTFKAVMEGEPALLSQLVRTQVEWLRELEERFHEMATDLVGPRVARQLVRLHEKMIQPGNGAGEIRLSHEELAQMTGTNLYTISRLFTEWEGFGIVRSRRQAVTVCDVALLREMSERR